MFIVAKLVMLVVLTVAVSVWSWWVVYAVFGPTKEIRPKGGWGQEDRGHRDPFDWLEDVAEKLRGNRRK